jgi:cytochrome c biogenesis protein CcdA
MELDDLKAEWAEHRALFQRSVALDERILREIVLGKVRSSLRPYAIARGLEVVFGAIVLALAVSVTVAHLTEPRYLVVAGTFTVFVASMIARCVHLLVASRELDEDGPVTAIQRRIERMKLAELHTFKWALLGGTLFWLPALLVILEAVTGFDALARVDLGYLVANMALGAVLLGAASLWARRYVDRPDIGPRARRIVDAVAGRSLHAASRRLAELARFVRDEA